MQTEAEQTQQPLPASPALNASRQHWPGLTSLRALAMLLGVTLHASIAYMPTQMEGLIWVVQDSSTAFCDVTFWWVHAWRLPLFFFLSGFFAKLTMDRHGTKGFAIRRFKRVFVPYIVAIYTILPLQYVVFAWGWYVTGQCTLEQTLPWIAFPSHLQENFFGPSHLWFLQDLTIMSSMYLFLCYRLGAKSDSQNPAETETLPAPSWWIPFALAVPAGLLLWGNPEPVLVVRNTFFADPARLLYYSLFFIGGIVGYHNRDWFFDASKFPRTHFLLAIPFSVLMMAILKYDIVDLEGGFGQLVMGIATAVVAWLMIYGMMGLFLHHLRTEHWLVQYVADSSYWIYLCHLPIVAFLHVLLRDVQIPPMAKFTIVSASTTGVGLFSYHWLIRYSRVGEFLHGPRRRPQTSGSTSSRTSQPTAANSATKTSPSV